MEEPEILKDLTKNTELISGDFDYVDANKLKQVGINWVKFLEQLPDPGIDGEPGEVLDKIQKEDLDDKYFAFFDAMGAYDNSNLIKWIKHFYGITQGDMK